jgi:hypothetical protein
MEGLTSHSACLRDLQRQARELTSDSLSLVNLFAEESSRLNRQDEASRIRALYSSIRRQLNEAKRLESAASYGHSRAKLITAVGGLAVGSIIKMTSKDKGLLAFSDHLLRNLGGKERPFGTVAVCIGPKGLPDDVGVISISELARESNREESEVISKLRERGHLLFSEEAFSRLIDRLVADVQEGRLLLPVPAEKLAEILTSSWVKLKAKQPRWVLRLEPPQKPRPSP